jgi:S-adenosylmethionine:tRNA ribosyltransferase-isomerase
MKLQEFDFELPQVLIANYPLPERAESRLLQYSCDTDCVSHHQFKDIVELLQPGDVIVRNNTKVLAARFMAQLDTGSKIELLLLESVTKTKFKALAGNAKRIKIGRKYFLANGLEIKVWREADEVFVEFASQSDYLQALDEVGMMPIPPYMQREAEDLDKERYQTCYAKHVGSVAAPTAGLHFTSALDASLMELGVEILELTLHVGLGTFAPIKVDDICDHKMHSEKYSIELDVWQKILNAKVEGRRVISVGSTSTRVLEAVARTGQLEGETSIFISPGFEFKVIDGMVTNFHLPKSSLIVLIAALIGLENVRKVYSEAVAKKYRFYSYGDACLFWPNKLPPAA